MPLASIDGTSFRTFMSARELSQARSEIAEARKVTARLVNALNSAKGTSSREEREARNQLLSDPSPVLASAITANKKIKERKRATLERCLSVPKRLDLGSPLSETATFKVEPKKRGGVRCIWTFGLTHRTAQEQVLRVMGCYFIPRPFQYSHKGTHKAIAATKLFVSGEYVHVAWLDISNCFGSFDGSKLASELPLPQGVVDHVVVGRHIAGVKDKGTGVAGTSGVAGGAGGNVSFPAGAEAPTHYGDCSAMDLLPQARQGIPLGSTCSPIIAAFIISRLAWNPSEHVKLVNDADDFLLLASSPSLLEEEVRRLQEAVRNLPGGHFDLKLKTMTHISEGVEFLGYHMVMPNGRLQTSPTEANWQTFMGKANRLETKLGKVSYLAGHSDKAKGLKCLAELYAYTTGWLAAFSECDRIEDYAASYMKNIQDHASTLGVTMEEVRAAVDESMRKPGNLYALNM